MAQLTIAYLGIFAALGCAVKIKKFGVSLDSTQQDLTHKIGAAKEAEAHPKAKLKVGKDLAHDIRLREAKGPAKANMKVDKWANCGEPVAYWGEGEDRANCPCKPDPTKKPIKGTLEARLKLLSQSPEHKWKLTATTNYKWRGQFYINLATSTKRRDFIEAQLKDVSKKIPTHRWAATDYKSAARANLKEFSNEGLNDYVREMGDREKWGTIATYMSHLRLLRRIWSQDKEGEGLYVIMEDDGTLNSKWQLKVEEALKNGDIPKDWDIIKFGYWGLTRCEDAVTSGAYEARNPLMVGESGRKSYYNGNLGYIVRPKSVPAILAAVRKQQVFDVDGVFVSLNHENSTALDYGIKTYYLPHSLVKGGTGGQFLATDRLGSPEEREASQEHEKH